MELSPAVTAGAVISGAYFGDKSSPLSDTANLAAAVAGADLYQHLREVLWTSIPALAITLLIFFFMGAPGDFDATEKLESIRRTFDVSLVHFLPLVVVIVLAALRFPPFTTIMMGALAGAVLAVVTAPERVIAFAADPDLATPLALLKGAWLALASGYTSTTGYEAIDMLASRGGMERMLDTIWLIIVALAFGGVVEKAGAIERLIAPVLAAVEVERRPRGRDRRLDGRHQRRDRRPVHRHRAARPDVQGRLPEARSRAGGAVAVARRFGDGDLGADSLEQLRRLHGRHARRGDGGVRTLHLLQLPESVDFGRDGVPRHPHAEGTVARVESQVLTFEFQSRIAV